jgi:hypothetical protein
VEQSARFMSGAERLPPRAGRAQPGFGVASAIPRMVQGQDRLRKEGTTMPANLVIVVRNPEPNRERSYPGTWLLYSREHEPLEVHVAHDGLNRPHVLNKGAA